jgi:hypothetical protein
MQAVDKQQVHGTNSGLVGAEQISNWLFTSKSHSFDCGQAQSAVV